MYVKDEHDRKWYDEAERERLLNRPVELRDLVSSHTMMKAIRRKKELTTEEKL